MALEPQQAEISPRPHVRVEVTAKRVRAVAGGTVVLDTSRPALVWEVPYYPAYYVPREDVRAELVDTGRTRQSSSRGEAHIFDVHTRGRVLEGAAWWYPDSPVEEIRGLVRFDWAAMDTWLEEDEPVYTHPRSPYVRVDILRSSRHVRIEVDGVTVAETSQPTLLFETGLPPRYYLPMPSVRHDLLRSSDSVTHCPYKGAASYWSVEVDGTLHEDLAWTYAAPLPESQKLAGLVAFYDEKVDVYVDGVRQERPRTKFS